MTTTCKGGLARQDKIRQDNTATCKLSYSDDASASRLKDTKGGKIEVIAARRDKLYESIVR
ncbi:hypothetical protein E2C01_092162 [Portunus trituberculatus]|uniref:Uncharacterized protein n=1 Tax=Portunus trituberculatus TaxID=210409 RepID=A0A5B7JKW0_PORTR|nr:hypothetical protein [Portunus trituberculatus]